MHRFGGVDSKGWGGWRRWNLCRVWLNPLYLHVVLLARSVATDWLVVLHARVYMLCGDIMYSVVAVSLWCVHICRY